MAHIQCSSQACVAADRDGTLGLTLDPQLIRDLTVLITSSTVRKHVFSSYRELPEAHIKPAGCGR